MFCRVKEVVAGFAKQILEGLNEKLCLPISRHFSYLPKGYHTICLHPNSQVLMDRFMTQCGFYIFFLLINISLSVIILNLAGNDPLLMGYVNWRENIDFPVPSEMTYARMVLEYTAIFIVPIVWFLSTLFLYFLLQCSTDIELENMQFVFKRNQEFGGCFLSKKRSSSHSSKIPVQPIAIRPLDIEKQGSVASTNGTVAQEEDSSSTSCSSCSSCWASFTDVKPPDFDLTGEWIDLYVNEVFILLKKLTLKEFFALDSSLRQKLMMVP